MPKIVAIDLATKAKTDHAPATVQMNPAILGFGGRADIVDEVKVVRFDDVRDAHWELYLQVKGGQSLKIDLVEIGYRVLNGATPRVGSDTTVTTITMSTPTTLEDALKALGKIAGDLGDWSGTDAYNCQDFAVRMLRDMGCSAPSIMPFELRRFVTKHRAPMIVSGRKGEPAVVTY